MNCSFANICAPWRQRLSTIGLTFAVVSCAHLNHPEATPPSVSLGETIDSAINSHSASFIKLAAQHIAVTRTEEAANPYILARITKELPQGYSANLKAAIDLYKLVAPNDAPRLFSTLVPASAFKVKNLAWKLAADAPSERMATAMKNQLSSMVNADDHSVKITPEMAFALKINHVADAYPFIRESLTAHGHPRLVQAMFALNPETAPDDLLTYLALLPQKRVLEGHFDPLGKSTVAVILTGFSERTPSLHHPDFPLLFAYALSRDKAISDRSSQLLALMLSQHTSEGVAAILQLPAELQNRYLQNLGVVNAPLAASITADLRGRDPNFQR